MGINETVVLLHSLKWRSDFKMFISNFVTGMITVTSNKEYRGYDNMIKSESCS